MGSMVPNVSLGMGNAGGAPASGSQQQAGGGSPWGSLLALLAAGYIGGRVAGLPGAAGAVEGVVNAQDPASEAIAYRNATGGFGQDPAPLMAPSAPAQRQPTGLGGLLSLLAGTYLGGRIGGLPGAAGAERGVLDAWGRDGSGTSMTQGGSLPRSSDPASEAVALRYSDALNGPDYPARLRRRGF